MTIGCILLCAAKLLANGDMEAMVGTSVAAWRLPKGYSVEDGRGRDGSRGLVWRNADPKAYVIARNRVAVRPGLAYRFGGWAKAVSFGRDADGAALYFDFYDKNGKWIGGLGSNAARKPGVWTRLEGKTDRAPENAAYGEVLVFCSQKAVGEAVFDDLYFEPIEEEFLGGVWCSAYRNAAAEGKVRFYAEFNAFAPEAKRKDLKMTFRIPRGRFEWVGLKTETKDGFAKAEADVTEFRYGMAPVQFWVTTGGVYMASKTVFFERYRSRDSRKVDAVGTDPYPITDLGQYPKATDGIRRAGDWTRQTLEGAFGGDRPVWQVPQAFDWAIIRGTEAERLAAPSRMPTEEEIRNMTWQCLANGANGIIFYCLSELRVMEKRLPFEQAFARVANVAKEVRAQEAMFLEGTSEPLATGNPNVVARRWTRADQSLLVVVNASEKPQSTVVAGERFDLKPIAVVVR